MSLKEAVRLYIETKAALTGCMQKHFRQVCHNCKLYSRCEVYANYVDAWINLQAAYKEGI